jgi:epoxide hydrolase-like predicted phosphatase
MPEKGASMIKAIIFDFGRVISAQKPASLFRSYERDLGLAPGQLNRIMFGSDAWQETLLGQKTAEDYWREIGPALGLSTADEIDAFRRRYHSDEAINTDVLNLIRRLHGRYKLAVLSNSPPNLAQWLADWGILDLFDVVVCSGDEGVAKPDPAIFELALERLDVAPQEAVFIDDYPGHVKAAHSFGLHAIHFTTAQALESELDELLVKRQASNVNMPHDV